MKPPQDRQLILVANAHMHWDPEYSDVKLIQTMMFLSELKMIAERASGSVMTGSPTSDPSAIPIVLCADLNSLPDSGETNITLHPTDWLQNVFCRSDVSPCSLTSTCRMLVSSLMKRCHPLCRPGVVEYLSNGGVAENHKDFRELRYSECLTNFSCNGKNSNSSGIITHSFQLKSAYDSNLMLYTNYTYDFKVDTQGFNPPCFILQDIHRQSSRFNIFTIHLCFSSLLHLNESELPL